MWVTYFNNGKKIRIGNDIIISLYIKDGKTKLGIDCDPKVKIEILKNDENPNKDLDHTYMAK